MAKGPGNAVYISSEVGSTLGHSLIGMVGQSVLLGGESCCYAL